MMTKTEIEAILRNNDEEKLKHALRESPSMIRKIQRFLYHADEDLRWAAAKAFGTASQVLETEKMKDLIRQLVWMINEESGNNCWFAPQALGEIGRVNPKLVEDFIPCLMEFYKYPDSRIQEGLRFAFEIFKQAGLEVPEFN